MFQQIVELEVQGRIARRAAWAAASTLAQAALVAALVFTTIRATPDDGPETPLVPLGRPVIIPPPQVRPPAPKNAASARPDVPTSRPVDPGRLVNPTAVAPEMRLPAANEPIEAVPFAPGDAGGDVVIGAPPAPEIEDAPRYATNGFVRPHEAAAGCVARAIRLPPELAGFVSGPVTVRFAVGRGGDVGRIDFVSQVPDRRIEAAVARALQSCRFVPGTDPRGAPVALWVVMPIRFEGG